MEDLFAAWNEKSITSTVHAGLLRERQHPVLKQIRKQMVIELVGFVLFLIVYYDFFDGDRKPVYANVLLVVAMLGVIAGNVVGYLFAKQGVIGPNLREALRMHLEKMKLYAVVAVMARGFMMGSVVVFFNAGWIVAMIFIVMWMVLAGIWVGRIRKIDRVYSDLSNPLDFGRPL